MSSAALPACGELLGAIRKNSGLALVVVLHRGGPNLEAATEELARSTELMVTEAQPDLVPAADHAYVTARAFVVEDGRLTPDDRPESARMPVDALLHSVSTAGGAAMGVILAGAGTDGTRGLAALRARGGFTFAQADARGALQSMPRSAMSAGAVDVAARPSAIAAALETLSRAIGSNRIALRRPDIVPAPDCSARTSDATDVAEAMLLHEYPLVCEYLRAIVQEQHATARELQAVNEHILANAETLRKLDRELEAANKELDGTAHSAISLVQGLEARNLELARANAELYGAMICADIAVVVVGADLRVRRFTPMAARVLPLMPSDIGRPIVELEPRMEAPGLDQALREVLSTQVAEQRRVRDRDGRCYALDIRPYRGEEAGVEGIVLCLSKAAADGPTEPVPSPLDAS